MGSHLPWLTSVSCCLLTCLLRYTKDIPQHGSTSAADGKPVIFPYIDLNIQTLQGSGQIRSSATAGPASGAYSQAPAAAGGMGLRPAVTPGRPGGLNGSMNSRAPGGGGAATDVMVTRLSQAFTRIASQNAAERVSCSHWLLLQPVFFRGD